MAKAPTFDAPAEAPYDAPVYAPADAAVGTIVMYRLTDDQVESVNRRRGDAGRNRHEISNGRHGYQAHVGNSVFAGQALPMLIVVAHPKIGDMQYVNGQVFLDGCDVLWVTSVRAGTRAGEFASLADMAAADKAATEKAEAEQAERDRDAADAAAAAEAEAAKATELAV